MIRLPESVISNKHHHDCPRQLTTVYSDKVHDGLFRQGTVFFGPTYEDGYLGLNDCRHDITGAENPISRSRYTGQ